MSATTRVTMKRKAAKFLASGKPATQTNIQEFLSAEYGRDMARARRGSASSGDLATSWSTLVDWMVEELATRGVAVVDE